MCFYVSIIDQSAVGFSFSGHKFRLVFYCFHILFTFTSNFFKPFLRLYIQAHRKRTKTSCFKHSVFL